MGNLKNSLGSLCQGRVDGGNEKEIDDEDRSSERWTRNYRERESE